jgi:hypothetical protein
MSGSVPFSDISGWPAIVSGPLNARYETSPFQSNSRAVLGCIYAVLRAVANRHHVCPATLDILAKNGIKAEVLQTRLLWSASMSFVKAYQSAVYSTPPAD